MHEEGMEHRNTERTTHGCKCSLLQVCSTYYVPTLNYYSRRQAHLAYKRKTNSHHSTWWLMDSSTRSSDNMSLTSQYDTYTSLARAHWTTAYDWCPSILWAQTNHRHLRTKHKPYARRKLPSFRCCLCSHFDNHLLRSLNCSDVLAMINNILCHFLIK